MNTKMTKIRIITGALAVAIVVTLFTGCATKNDAIAQAE
jgi:hypothetical protein